MPQGYDTRVANDAESISQGQRQLLTIARVLLNNPAILILDEATSSVDTRTELAIGRAMDALMRGRTSFVIAHRLSTIVDADLILVMDHGNIIEQGTHKELLAAEGAYADLYLASSHKVTKGQSRMPHRKKARRGRDSPARLLCWRSCCGGCPRP